MVARQKARRNRNAPIDSVWAFRAVCRQLGSNPVLGVISAWPVTLAIQKSFENLGCRARIENDAVRLPAVRHFSRNVGAAILALEIWPIASIKTAAASQPVRIAGELDIDDVAKVDNEVSRPLIEPRSIFLDDPATWKEICAAFRVPLRSRYLLKIVRQSNRTLFTDDVHSALLKQYHRSLIYGVHSVFPSHLEHLSRHSGCVVDHPEITT
jgi:hypothetical protein